MILSRNFQMKKEKEWMCKKLYNRKKDDIGFKGLSIFPTWMLTLTFPDIWIIEGGIRIEIRPF
jgi:hypothetical protein